MSSSLTPSDVLPSPMFTRENYHVWSVFMSPERDERVKIEAEDADSSRIKKTKALLLILRSVAESIVPKILTCTSPKQAWEKLRDEYAGTEKTKSQILNNLIRDFETLRMKKDETIRQYADRASSIVSKIKLYGDDSYSDKNIIRKISNTLPNKYEVTLSSIENSGRNTSDLTLVEFVSSLHALEQRLKNREEDGIEAAMVARNRDSSKGKQWQKGKGKKPTDKQQEKKPFPPCPHCKKATHGEKFCWWRPDAVCKICKEKGHVDKVCKKKKQYKGESSQAQVVEEEDNRDENQQQIFVATCFTSSCIDSSTWLIDSGCSNHMVADDGMFKSIDRTFYSKVKIGDGKFLEAVGKGEVFIQTPKGTKIIPDVLLVPEISHNLLSVG